MKKSEYNDENNQVTNSKIKSNKEIEKKAKLLSIASLFVLSACHDEREYVADTPLAEDDPGPDYAEDPTDTFMGRDDLDLSLLQAAAVNNLTIVSMGGNDNINTGSGADTIDGAGGNDTIHAGGGDDNINGGEGNDSLFGEDGADNFVFTTSWGVDDIEDFEDGTDLIDLSGSGLTYGDITITRTGNTALIEDSAGNSVRVIGVNDFLTTADIILDNNAPTGSVVITGTPTEDQVLTATNTLADGDGMGTLTYQWQRDGVDVIGATNDTYTLDQDDVGGVMTVKIYYTDGHNAPEMAASAATAAVVNINDAPTGTVTITGTTTEGEILTASNNLADEDGLGAISYQWQRDGVDIVGATNANYTLVNADVGAVMSVVASYTDGFATDESEASADTAAVAAGGNTAPTGTVTITGTPTEDQVLAASNNLADVDVLGAITYQWQRDGVDIGGATNTNYTLIQADVGAVISVVASYTDGGGANESVSSADTAAVANVNDDPGGTVSISGTATKGEDLTASNNLTDEDGLGAISYQWQRGGVDIGGETNATYTLVDADVGAVISVTASYTDGEGTAESEVSADTAAVADVAVVISNIQLSSLDGTDGFRLDGTVSGDKAGWSVSSAGDVNGDGFDDLIIGAPDADPNGSYSGSSYVVFGTDAAMTATVNLSSLDGTNGFRLDGGETTNDWSGYSVSSAGDFNGDGYDDLIIGAFGADPNGSDSGSSYVVFGSVNAFAATINLSSLDGTNGFRLDGAAFSDLSGRSVSSAGDVNGDGYDDLIIGAAFADTNSSYSGSSYVVFGTDANMGANANLSSLDGTNGFRLDGGSTPNDFSGWSVSSAGDFNGDGYDDLIIGAYDDLALFGFGTGSSFVVYGSGDAFAATINLSSLDGTNGFRLDGVATDDQSGWSVSSAGDINGDGYDDLIIGAKYADPSGDRSGSSYVVFGTAANMGADVNLSTLDGTNGFRLDGVAINDQSGRSVSSAGDVNGDGYDDLIIGAPFADPNGAISGSSYVVFGTGDAFAATFDLSSLDGTNGFRIDGETEFDESGYSVSSVGDFNGDGYDDLIIGAFGADPNSVVTGTSYVIYGGSQFAATAQAATAGDDVLNGTAGVETLNGGDGNDTLAGLGGDDIIIGGAGTDSLDGGTGADDLYGGGNLDTFILEAGDSELSFAGVGDTGTVSGYDTIHDFDTGNGTFNSETINTVGTASVVANTAGTDGADSTLTIGGATIKSHAITDGVITFDDADTFAGLLDINTNSEIAAALDYLQNQDFGDAGASVSFDVGSDAFLFTQGDAAGTDNLDVLVRLEGAQVDSLITTIGTGEFDLYIF